MLRRLSPGPPPSSGLTKQRSRWSLASLSQACCNSPSKALTRAIRWLSASPGCARREMLSCSVNTKGMFQWKPHKAVRGGKCCLAVSIPKECSSGSLTRLCEEGNDVLQCQCQGNGRGEGMNVCTASLVEISPLAFGRCATLTRSRGEPPCRVCSALGGCTIPGSSPASWVVCG
jgi:hypothetical protein